VALPARDRAFGWGSRGLAHAGVLRALAEEGLVPDCVAGTSAGALVGALNAAGYDAADTLRFFDDANPFRFSHLALRKPGFIDSEKIEPSFRRCSRRLVRGAREAALRHRHRPRLGPARDLELRAADPAAPRLLGRAVRHRSTRVDGRLYADGGIVDNFPVSPLVGLCDVILGVYASPLSHPSTVELDSSFAVSQRALGDRHVPRLAPQVPPRRPGDQPARAAALLDLRRPRHAEIAELGYRVTLERMGEIKKLIEHR